MRGSLGAVPYQQEPWASHYPWLVGILADEPCVPKYNSVQRNVFKSSGALNIDESAKSNGTVENNWLTTEDLRFVNQADGDLTLASDSPVFANIEGFEALPFERMRKSIQEPLDIGITGWSGTGHPSTAQVHSGANSHAVLADREVLTHYSGLQTQGTVTVWFWDDATDTSMSAVANAAMGDSGLLFRALGVSTPASQTHYVYRTATTFVPTELPRSTGWHSFQWVYGVDDTLEMRIDDVLVATHDDSPSFDRIQIGDWWADNQTGAVYFDDVSIQDLEPTVPPVTTEPGEEPTTGAVGDMATGSVNLGSLVAGQEATITGEHFMPGTTATFTLHSDPVLLGSAVASADGRVSLTVTVPATVPAGNHTVVIAGTGTTGDAVEVSIALTVAAVGDNSPDVTPTGSAVVTGTTGPSSTPIGPGEATASPGPGQHGL